MLTKAVKSEQIADLSSRFEKAQGHFIVQFQGLNVEQMGSLRDKLRSKQAQMKVIRNTLALRAMEGQKRLKTALGDSLTGANAFVLAFGDVSQTAKVLADFSEISPALKLKKGMIGKDILAEKEILHLASLPSLDELRAKLVILLNTPASSFVRTANAVGSTFVRLLSARAKKLES